MRNSLRMLAITSLVVLGSVQTQANVIPVSASLGIQIGTLPPVIVQGSGLATTTGPGHVGAVAFSASLFKATGALLTLPVGTGDIGGLRLTVHNGAGTFSGGTGMGTLGGVMPLIGVTKVCLLVACDATPAPPANLSVPLSVVGTGGASTVATLINVTTIGAPWTTATAAVGGLVWLTGFRHGPGSLTSSTALHGGSIRLITPVFISTNIGSLAVVPAFGVLDLHFMPEPGTAVLLASGIVGLVMFGQIKRS